MSRSSLLRSMAPPLLLPVTPPPLGLPIRLLERAAVGFGTLELGRMVTLDCRSDNTGRGFRSLGDRGLVLRSGYPVIVTGRALGRGGTGGAFPNEERLSCVTALGPVDRFMEDVGAYRLLDGSGKNVGVWGREIEEAEEEAPPDNLD